MRVTDVAESFADRPHVLVPTMGALHEGHLSLIRRGAQISRERGLAGVAVSVFVNPTQFNDPADYERYPRTLESDAAKAASAGAAVVWAPAVGEVYPEGLEVAVGALPAVATEPGLEDRHRPGHFAGVVQVVRRLFELARPAAAVFGEKDWQQLQVIRAMVAGEGLGVKIAAGETVREADGLAMSSRNVFLSAEERAAAGAVPRALAAARGETDPVRAEGAMLRVLTGAGLSVDYAVVRDAATLMALPVGWSGGAARAILTVRAGATRLLDNAPWP